MTTTIPVPALACSITLHAGVLAWSLCSFSPSLPAQQVVDVEVVAVSSLEPAKMPAPIPAKAAVIERPALKSDPLSPIHQQVKKQESQPAQMAMTKPTSGPQSPEATKTLAAQTPPLFNAAYLHNTPPAYPDDARREEAQGTVLLKVDVTAQGDAANVRVQQSSGNAALDTAALDAVKRWHFVPAMRGDETQQAKVTIPIEFKLE